MHDNYDLRGLSLNEEPAVLCIYNHSVNLEISLTLHPLHLH